MDIVYNSQNSEYKKPFGAVRCSTEVYYTVKSNSADKIVVFGFDKTYEMHKTNDMFTVTVEVPDEPCLVHYYFEISERDKKHYIVPKEGTGGEGIISNTVSNKFQLTIYENEPVPKWFKGAVMYQIYVDRFYRPVKNPELKANILYHSSWNDKPIYIFDSKSRIVKWDFFGGSLKGVIEKLDYIKSLGVDIIYLNPIFEASSNHKYDTGDYFKIDPMYGDDSILKELIEKAKQKDINIILDGVFSHTGDDSIYFNKFSNYPNKGAYQGEESPYYNWFTFNKFPDDYKCWWGIDSLPEADKDNASYRDFLFSKKNGVIKKWMQMGIMGWRLDVADELPDDFIKEMKETVRYFSNESILLGEVWEDASNKISYDISRRYIIDNCLDSVSNYPLRDGIAEYLLGKLTAKELGRLIMSIQENYPKDVFCSLMNLTGTHDSIRLATLMGEAPGENKLNLWEKREYNLDEQSLRIAVKRIKLFYVILFTLPGNPCIYYGDEMAVEGYKDPYNRSTFPWQNTRDDIRNLIGDLSKIKKSFSAYTEGFFRSDNTMELSYLPIFSIHSSIL